MKQLFIPALMLLSFGAPLLVAESFLKNGDQVLFLGDSITVASTTKTGFVTLIDQTLDERYPDNQIQFQTIAKGGRGIKFLKSAIQSKMMPEHPDVVVIFIGINDVRLIEDNKGSPPDEYRVILKKLIASCKAMGAKVVVCSPAVRGEKTKGHNPYDVLIDEYAQVCREVAAETESVFIDLRTGFMDELSRINLNNDEAGHLTKDGIHPNAAGNKFIANTLLTQWGYTPIP